MTRITDGRDAGAFITSDLDDFGLDPYAFRLYGRIARRAGGPKGCFESIDNMAIACRMNRDTAYKALKTLLAHRLIAKEPHAGKPSSYWLTPREEWIQLPDLSQIRDTEPIPNQGHHLSQIRDTEPIPNQGHHLSQIRDTTYPKSGTPPIPNQGHKGIKEGNPIKGTTGRCVPEPVVDPFFSGQVRAIARELKSQSSAAKNFITDAPWGKLAEEMRQDPESVWLKWKNYLLTLHDDKKDPESYVGKICNEIYQNPGSELNCKAWTDFAEHFKKNISAPPPPQKRQPRQPQITQIPDRETSRKALQEAKRAINPPA